MLRSSLILSMGMLGCLQPGAGVDDKGLDAEDGDVADKADPAPIIIETDDAYVDSSQPSANYGSAAYLEIDKSPTLQHALIRPQNLASIPSGARVRSARLVLRVDEPGNVVSVRELMSTFSEGNVNYANAPGRSNEIGTLAGSVGQTSVDVTALVQRWVNGEGIKGLSLYPTGNNGVHFCSAEHSNASYRPYFEVSLVGQDTGRIAHQGTTQVWYKDGNLTIRRPSSLLGDLLILALHRTDDVLPLDVPGGWTRAAACYKVGNGSDCTVGKGEDLAQAIFFKTVGFSEPPSYTFNLGGSHPSWALLSVLRGANNSSPVRAWASKGCDGSPSSKFPSVYGETNDMVLLSQSYDDAIGVGPAGEPLPNQIAVAGGAFGAPAGTSRFGFVSKSDEAGFLFGGTVTRTGQTGIMETRGAGGWNCKDGLVSLTIKPR